MAMPEAVERGQSTQIRGGRRALVRLDGQPVGTFEETERGTRFTYDPAWLQRPDAVPISLVLPLGSEPYDWPGLHPVFENLLPEGWLLGIATTKLRIAPDDGFGLLLAPAAVDAGDVLVRQDAPQRGRVQWPQHGRNRCHWDVSFGRMALWEQGQPSLAAERECSPFAPFVN